MCLRRNPATMAGCWQWWIARAAIDYQSELWILDADNISAAPVARVKVPVPLRPQVHGWWVSAEQLASSK